MQTLKYLIFISLLAMTSLSQGAIKLKNEMIFSLVVIKKYSKQHTAIYKEGSEYYCKTELNPKNFIINNDKEKVVKSYEKKLRSAVKEKIVKCSSNGDKVLFTVGSESFEICSDNKNGKDVLALLAEDCGRNF